MSLETRFEQVDGRVPITVLSLDGELDASNFETVVDEVRAAYEAGARQLVIDMSKLSFMASSGLVALHSIVRIFQGEPPLDPEAGWSALHAEVGEGQTAVRLAAPQPAVARVLSRTGLDRLFHVDQDRDAAIAAI